MPTRHHPRREPRVLAFVARGAALAWASVDALEIRSTGQVRLGRGSTRGLGLRRILLAEKPTAVVMTASLADIVRRVALRARVPIVSVTMPVIAEEQATLLFSELPYFAATSLRLHAARLAITALLSSTFPSRSYVPRGPQTPLRGSARAFGRPRNPLGTRACAARVP